MNWTRYQSNDVASNICAKTARAFLAHVAQFGVICGELRVNEMVGGMAVADYVPLSDLIAQGLPEDLPINIVAQFPTGMNSVGKLYNEKWVKISEESNFVSALRYVQLAANGTSDPGVVLRNSAVSTAASDALKFPR